MIKYVGIHNAQNLNSVRLDIPCATFAIPLPALMRLTIQLDHQLNLRAIKVRDEWPDRMLPAEFEAVELAAPEEVPEFLFGGGTIAAHFTREFQETGIDRRHGLCAIRKEPSP